MFLSHTVLYVLHIKMCVFCISYLETDLWAWHSHVQFCADGHTGNLLVVSAKHLHGPRRQRAGEATLKWENNARWSSQDLNPAWPSFLFLPAVEPATRYRMCLLSLRWGRCHTDPEPSTWQHLWGNTEFKLKIQNLIDTVGGVFIQQLVRSPNRWI